MASDAKVIDDLRMLYRACNTAAEQVRRLKVRFLVKYRYCKLVHALGCLLHCECCRKDHFGEAEHQERHKHQQKCGCCLPCFAIHALRRIERLGGDADSELDTVSATDDVGEALGKVHRVLEDIVNCAEALSDSKDELSKKIAGEIHCECDKHLECVEAHLRQIDELKNDYILTIT
jgi:hypothetical protein